MKVILFGATGMVGQGVLRECIADSDVTEVLIIGRTALDTKPAKTKEIVHSDLYEYDSIASELTGYDACFFCLGVSAAGMSEADYTHVTYDLTMAAAKTLAEKNPKMTFIYVSGASTDSSEKGSAMWARVKGKTENALKNLPFAHLYMFRPGIIQPLHGIKSKTKSYRILYTITAPIFPILNAIIPKAVTTTERVGIAMLEVAKHGSSLFILENRDINEIAAR